MAFSSRSRIYLFTSTDLVADPDPPAQFPENKKIRNMVNLPIKPWDGDVHQMTL